MLKALTCPACQASLELPETLTQPTIRCPYCNTTAIVPEDLRHSGQGLASTSDADKALEEVLQLLLNDEKIAAIKRYREFFNVDLKTAKESVEALEIDWSRQMGADPRPKAAAPKSSGCAGGFVVLMTLLVLAIGGAGALLYFMVTPTESSVNEAISIISQEVGQVSSLRTLHLNGPDLLLPVGDGVLADVVFTNRDLDQDGTWVNYFASGHGDILWQSETFYDKLGNQALYADEQHIYYISENNLTALKRADGRTAWQTLLSDRLPYTCADTCLLSFGDWLVVQTLDNQLHGLNIANGELAWSTRLNLSSPRGISRVGEWTAVLADNSDTGGGLDLFDPASGRLAQRLEPRCPHPTFDPQDPSFTDPFLVDESEQSVYFLFGFFDPLCLQKWDYGSNSQVWSIFLEEDLPSSNEAFIQDATNLYYNTSDSQIFAAAKSDGRLTLLVQDDDYDLIPQATRSNVLLVKALRTIGSSREELWGVDVVEGGVLWKYVPQANEEAAAGSLSVIRAGESGLWTAQPGLSGVRLLQARHDPARLVLETLGLRDGASSGQQDLPIGSTFSSSYWFALIGWDGDVVWVEVDLREIWAINAATGEIVTRVR